MKKQIITFSALACLALASIPAVMAKPCEGQRGGEHGKHGGDAMRVLMHLDLSDQQQLDIKAIMQQTREDNSAFAGEKKEMMLQMHDIMNMPAWDAQTARQLISAQMEQGKDIQLNRAEAKHQVFNLLTDEQKAELASQTEKPKKHKGKRKGHKGEGKMHKRLAKALELTDDQKAQWKAMHAANKALKDDFKPVMKAHRDQVKLIVQAEVFDADAWLTLQDGFASELIEHRVLAAEAKYNTMTLLTVEQKEKFKKIRNKMKEKHGK